MTPGVQDLVVNRNLNLMKFLRRHLTGDWGDVPPGNKRANDAALQQKERVLSAYEVMPNVKIWFITEGDRQATTALLQSEY
jgi:hypothetical protein